MLKLLDLFCDFASGKGLAGDSFIVGGTVRDMLLDRTIKDADVTVKADVISISRTFADAVGGTFVLLDEGFGMTRVALNHEFIDICSMRGGSISDDLTGRDLTINAMALPLAALGNQPSAIRREKLKEIIIDPFNGCNDLKDGIIRMVSEKNLVADPLRLLRVYRFAATLGFSIEGRTSAAVKAHASLISSAAAERVTEELRHILRVDSSSAAIKEMERDGILFPLFPELAEFSAEAWYRVRQSYENAEHILLNLPFYFPDRCGPIRCYLAEDFRRDCLKLSVLFEDGERAEKVSRRLKLSRKETDFIRMLSSNHQIAASMDTGRKSVIIGLLREFGDDIYAMLLYLLACGGAYRSSNAPSLVPFARDIVSIYQDEFIPRQKKLPFINGNDLIEEFSLSPSPFFKDILSAIELLALEGLVNSREEALREAGVMIREKGIGPYE